MRILFLRKFLQLEVLNKNICFFCSEDGDAMDVTGCKRRGDIEHPSCSVTVLVRRKGESDYHACMMMLAMALMMIRGEGGGQRRLVGDNAGHGVNDRSWNMSAITSEIVDERCSKLWWVTNRQGGITDDTSLLSP